VNSFNQLRLCETPSRQINFSADNHTMKLRFSACLLFLSPMLFAAAPLEGKIALASGASASQEEKDLAYSKARDKVIIAAMKYENTPYRYGGVSSSGLDCSGFIYVSFNDALGVSLPRSASGLYSWAEKIPLEKAQPGDLLFFKTDGTGGVSHVALYLGGQRFIHAASEGARTGVIYTSLGEGSWARNYAGAGRAFPETSSDYKHIEAGGKTASSSAGNWNSGRFDTPSEADSSWDIFIGAAFAPSWKGFIGAGGVVRGFTSQLRAGIDTELFDRNMIFGLELRPEFDGALGVFRLPLTVSWGLNDKFRIFAGPVLSFGSASFSASDGERRYSGGTSLLGTIGITAAPFIFNTSRGDFAPYVEAAWQSYSSDNQIKNFSADLGARFRFSTGLRWTMQLN
jgi:cell wall-associated NlpC family hydrolase